MIISNTNVKHIKFGNAENYLFEIMNDIIDDIRETMKKNKCNLMYNTQTGECISLNEFDRFAGILGGLGSMDEILEE